MSRYVLLYESAEDVASEAPAHFPAHRALAGVSRGRDIAPDRHLRRRAYGSIREWNEALQRDE